MFLFQFLLTEINEKKHTHLKAVFGLFKGTSLREIVLQRCQKGSRKAPAILEFMSATEREGIKKNQGWPKYKRNRGRMSLHIPSL